MIHRGVTTVVIVHDYGEREEGKIKREER